MRKCGTAGRPSGSVTALSLSPLLGGGEGLAASRHQSLNQASGLLFGTSRCRSIICSFIHTYTHSFSFYLYLDISTVIKNLKLGQL